MLPDPRLNIYWTVLAQGKPSGLSYVRRITPAWFASQPAWAPVLDALTQTPDDIARCFQIEQLVQLVLHSNQRERLLAFDGLNSYEKARLSFPAPGFVTNCPLTSFFQGTGAIPGFEFACTLNTITQRFTTPAGVFSYTVSNNLSSPLPLAPGATLRVQGPFLEPAYQFTASYSAVLRVDWPALMTRLQALKVPWADTGLRDIWATDPSWVQELAALIVDLVENNAEK